jgi:hypothetical protein
VIRTKLKIQSINSDQNIAILRSRNTTPITDGQQIVLNYYGIILCIWTTIYAIISFPGIPASYY